MHYLESLIGTLIKQKEEPTPELPYEPIEWLGFTTGASVPTNVYMSDGATCTIRQRILSTAESKALFGYNSGYQYQYPSTSYRNNKHFYYLNNEWSSSLIYAADPTEVCDVIYTIDIDNSLVTLSVNTEEKSVALSLISDQFPFSIGANRTDEYAKFANNYIVYSAKAENSTGLLFDYIPCKLKSTGAYGFWDKVSDSFISVSGNGTTFVP